MKLVKFTSAAALALLLTHTAKAQVYINVGVGYGAPALREMLLVDYDDQQNSTTYKGVYSSLGAGLQPQIAFGYKFNPNIGLEFGYGYLLGQKVTADINDASSPNVETGTQEMWARMHQFMIGARVTASEGSWQPYMRVGMGFGVGGRLYTETETTTSGPSFSSSYHSMEEFDGGVAFGFTGGLGIHYHLTEMFGIYGEASMVAQNWSPNHSEITTLDFDGQDQLGSMTIRDKQTDYVKEYTATNPPNDGQPDEELRFFVPMSSIGVTVGVHFYFGE
jgi:opacity protein-like surface antigen